MEAGHVFHNGTMTLTCLAFHAIGNRNVGLFQRRSDGTYVTARNTSKDKNGTYSWAWGHYFTNYDDAKEDYKKRLQEMLSYRN